MAKRQREWAQRALFCLFEELGSRCASCGTFGEEEDVRGGLEFDCIEPQGDAHHRWETGRRASFYRRQHAERNLQLLCFDCHLAKSRTEHPAFVCEPF